MPLRKHDLLFCFTLSFLLLPTGCKRKTTPGPKDNVEIRNLPNGPKAPDIVAPPSRPSEDGGEEPVPAGKQNEEDNEYDEVDEAEDAKRLIDPQREDDEEWEDDEGQEPQ